MFCTKCGKEIADGSMYCPLCGQQFKSSEPAPAKTTSDFGANVSSFFKDYFKNPIEAVATRAKDSFWLLGLISIGAYILVHFFVSLFSGYEGYIAQYAFGTLFIDLICFAALIFGVFLFASAFKLNKLSLPSTVALTGLALLPLVPVYLVGLLFDKLIEGASVTTVLFTIAFIFAAIILYSQIREASNDVAGIRTMFAILLAFGCMLLIRNICEVIQMKSLLHYYTTDFYDYYNFLG
jgi:hypothetical protein